MSIELRNVSKKFGGVTAVNDVNFSVKEGELVALLGPSGGVPAAIVRGVVLEAGDVGTVVHIHRAGLAFEVEFVTLAGRTVAVVTVEASDVRPIGKRDISHVRELQTA